MSDPAPSATPEPTPFDKFVDFTRRIIAVPKEEADEKEREWREERAKATGKKTLQKPH